jgi:hypothetical protein
MIVTRRKFLTFEPLTCGWSMISRHMTFLLVGAFTENLHVRYVVRTQNVFVACMEARLATLIVIDVHCPRSMTLDKTRTHSGRTLLSQRGRQSI